MGKGKIKIGYVNPEYNARRNIIDKCSAARYVRVRSYQSMRSKLGRCMPWFRKPNGMGFVFDGGLPWPPSKVDIYHFFDRVLLGKGKIPWISTFEDFLPRGMEGFPSLAEQSIEAMLSDTCKWLIAFSDCARLHQELYCQEHGGSDICKKVTVLLPLQKLKALDAIWRICGVKDVMRTSMAAYYLQIALAIGVCMAVALELRKTMPRTAGVLFGGR